MPQPYESDEAVQEAQSIAEEAGLGSSWVPVDAPPIVPGAPAPPSAHSLKSAAPTYLQGTLSPSFQHDVTFVDTELVSSNIPKVSMMPLGLNADPARNASLASTSRATVVATSVADTDTTVTDGITHSNAPWWIDPAFSYLRDDFVAAQRQVGENGSDVGSVIFGQIGELGWALMGTYANSGGGAQNNTRFFGGAPPNLGQFCFCNPGTFANQTLAIVLKDIQSGFFLQHSFALLENPGWRSTFIFKLESDIGLGSALDPVSFTKKAIYVGFIGPSETAIINSASSRPLVFIGLRYDTNTLPAGMPITSVAAGTGVYTGTFANANTGNGLAGQNITVKNCTNAANNGTFACTASTATTITLSNGSSVTESNSAGIAVPTSYVLTAAANASAGLTTYTLTNIGGSVTQNSLTGLSFVVTGFSTGANNGTFTCDSNTSTTLVLQNSGGVAETHAGFATTSAQFNDTVFVYEVVENHDLAFGTRTQKQGQIFSTGVTPTIGTWYRLDFVCASAGVVTITLNGANSKTFIVPTMLHTSSAQQVTKAQAPTAAVEMTSKGNGNSTMGIPQFGVGSVVTFSGFTGTSAVLNGTQILTDLTVESGTPIMQFRSNATYNQDLPDFFSYVGYPALCPTFMIGNDDTVSPVLNMRMFVDFFGLVWNPNLGPNAPGTTSATLARYF